MSVTGRCSDCRKNRKLVAQLGDRHVCEDCLRKARERAREAEEQFTPEDES